MAAENHNGGRSPSVDPTKVDQSLDDLAKGLAGGTISRREAVRLVGATLLGGALASVLGFAWAQQGLGLMWQPGTLPQARPARTTVHGSSPQGRSERSVSGREHRVGAPATSVTWH